MIAGYGYRGYERCAVARAVVVNRGYEMQFGIKESGVRLG